MLAAVERAISDVAGTTVRVIDRELLADARGRVERMSLEPVVDGIGATVVAKARALDGWSTVSLDTERAALVALEAAGVDVAPRLVGSTEDDGLLVLGDVGRQTVERVLFGGTAAEATAALVAMAEAAAMLNGVRLEQPLVPGGRTWTIGSHGIDWPLMTAMVDELGFPPAARAGGDAAAVVDALLDPGGFATFVHADLTPNNAVLDADGRCRLVDFEGADRQHVGIDASMFRFPFAWYGRWASLSGPVQVEVESAYRAALGRPDGEVDRAVAVGCAAMTLVRLQRLRRIADAAQERATAQRRRVQIVATIEAAAAAATQAAMFPALVAWWADIADAMRSRWPEAAAPPPVFPAFG